MHDDADELSSPVPEHTSAPQGRSLDRAIYCRYASGDRRLILFAVILIGIINFGFIVEQWETPTHQDGSAIIWMRSLLLIISLAFAAWIPFARSISILQTALLGWQLVSSTLFAWTDHLLPPNAYQNSMADLAYLLAIFIFLPNRLSYQMASGIYFMTIHIWMLHAHEGFTALWWEAALIFPVTCVCGAYISWRLHQTRITEYLQWQREHDARIKLEQAMDRIKTLTGLLPICAYCKKVRDTEGSWHEVESYVRERSTAEFSHSLCPDCGEEHYPGILSADDFQD